MSEGNSEAEKRALRAAYDGATSPGEAKAMRRDEHLCTHCVHDEVCELSAVVARREAHMLPVISRCLVYLHIEAQELSTTDTE